MNNFRQSCEDFKARLSVLEALLDSIGATTAFGINFVYGWNLYLEHLFSEFEKIEQQVKL